MSVLDRSAHEIYDLVKQASSSKQRLDIVGQHLDNPVVAQLFNQPQFFEWFDLGDKTKLLESVLLRYPMPSATWLGAAMYSGVDSDLLSNLVINQLRYMDPSPLANFIETFVRDGAGHVGRNTKWATEEDYEREYPLSQTYSNYSPWLAVGTHLKEILDRCVLLWPKAFFLESTDEVLNPDGAMTPYERMNSLRPESNGPSRFNRPDPFLLQGEASEVLAQAAKQLTSLEGLSMKALSQLDSWTRNHVAYKCLEGSLPFLVMAALRDETVECDFESLFRAIAPRIPRDRAKVLESIKQVDNVLDSYVWLSECDQSFPEYMLAKLAEVMNTRGYAIAQLKEHRDAHRGPQTVAYTFRGGDWKKTRYVKNSPHVFVLNSNLGIGHNSLVVIDLEDPNVTGAHRFPIHFEPVYTMKTQTRITIES